MQLPLIDNSDIDMHPELWDARLFGYDSLRASIDNILSRDPDDLAARFIALTAYYRLMATKIPREIQYSESLDQVSREEIISHLGYLVRLRDPATCTDAVKIRGEIANASAVKDYPRMLALCDQLKGAVPDGERHYPCGRVHFLIALLPSWFTEECEESLDHWDLPLGPAPEGLRAMWREINALTLMGLGIQRKPAQASLADDGRDHLHDAAKFLEKAIRPEWTAPASARFMLARSYASVDDSGNAAKQYQWMLDHQSAFLLLAMGYSQEYIPYQWMLDHQSAFLRQCKGELRDILADEDLMKTTVRFMMLMIPKGYENAASDAMPNAEAVAAMMKYNESLRKAGVLLALDGLHPPSSGVRVSFAGGKPKVTDGPFAEVNEVIGGYWMIQVKSKEEAIEWAKRCPASEDEVIELRQVQELAEFPPDVQQAAAKYPEMQAQSGNRD